MNFSPVIDLATPIAGTQPARVLYAGAEGDEICTVLSSKIGEIDVVYKSAINEVFTALRRQVFDVIVLDLRGNNPAIKLALPIVSSLPKMPRITVICQKEDVGTYLRLRGVWRVLSHPLEGGQLITAICGKPKKAVPAKADLAAPGPQLRETSHASMPAAAPAPMRAPLPATPKAADNLTNRFFGFGMAIVSMLYKRAAFVLLATLFSAFLFYGILILFFLLSNTWAAPMTLTKGHELVAKADAEMNQLQVSLNLTKQRIAETKLEHDMAQQKLEQGRAVVSYSIGTIERQIEVVKARSKTLKADVKAQRELVDAFSEQLDGGEFNKNLKRLYQKRLIDKATYQSGLMGMLEAKQRMQSIQSSLAEREDELANVDSTLAMLNSLRTKLEGKSDNEDISASSSDMMQLVTQSLDARTAVDSAQSEIANALDKQVVLERSLNVLETQIADLQKTPLVRAITERIDVLYVPYGNEQNYTEGQDLYSCALTVLWCRHVGTVGNRFPGESAGVHPFFGKPIRGIFVEVHLTDTFAATQEIIHANRPPLFF
jgi:hypothetical protein